MKVDLGTWTLEEGYVSTAARGRGGSRMAKGSRNAMHTGEGMVRAFRGAALQAGKVGSRVFSLVDQTYAGLGTAAAPGAGSVFGVRQLLAAVGSGAVAYDGALVPGFASSSVLSFVKKSGGAYAAGALTGPFQAGHAQPSAPSVFAKDSPSAGHTAMSGVVTVVVWRVSSITGQVSLMSLPSNELTLSGQSVIVQMPLADTNGQDYWGVGVVKLGFADLGVYYQLPVSLGGEVAETALSTIDGYARAVEISWTNGALQGQPVAPDKAFPPPPGQFAGVINDTLFLDADGIIYVGEPGYVGSFPPSNALFASEPAVAYVRAADGYLRFGRTSVGVLTYEGGSPALGFQNVLEGQGVLHQQNVAQGEAGRVLAWMGHPAVVSLGGGIDTEFARAVSDEFAGWEAQTSAAPVVPAYDPVGRYEVWCRQKKAMAFHVPSGRWCAPVDLTGLVSGDVVAAVTAGQKLFLSCSDGAALSLYQFDAGSGSVMVVQTDDWEGRGYGDTITEVVVGGRADNTATPVVAQLVKNYDDSAPLALSSANPPRTGRQQFARRRVNVLGAKAHALRVTMTSQGGDCGVDVLRTRGAVSEVVTS